MLDRPQIELISMHIQIEKKLMFSTTNCSSIHLQERTLDSLTWVVARAEVRRLGEVKAEAPAARERMVAMESFMIISLDLCALNLVSKDMLN